MHNKVSTTSLKTRFQAARLQTFTSHKFEFQNFQSKLLRRFSRNPRLEQQRKWSHHPVDISMKVFNTLRILLTRSPRFYAAFSSKSRSPPEPPPAELCCMSGCANCVWVTYAEELVKFYGEGKDKAAVMKDVSKHIEDPSLREFVKLELKTRL